MRERLGNIYRLGIKELCSLRRDAVMVFLIVYSFAYAVYAPARQAATAARDSSGRITSGRRPSLTQRRKYAHSSRSAPLRTPCINGQ